MRKKKEKDGRKNLEDGKKTRRTEGTRETERRNRNEKNDKIRKIELERRKKELKDGTKR